LKVVCADFLGPGDARMLTAAQARGRDLPNDYQLRTKAHTTREGIVASGRNLCQFFQAAWGKKRGFQGCRRGFAVIQ
jgi:hypothetical protein